MNERTSNPGGAAGHGVHGFVHGKLCEVEHENVGTEGAHRSELVGEAVGGKMVRFTQKRVRTRPARAAARSESQFIKARADYQTRKLVSAPVIKCKKTPRKKCNFVAERREKRQTFNRTEKTSGKGVRK